MRLRSAGVIALLAPVVALMPAVVQAETSRDTKTLCMHTQWISYEDREDGQTLSFFLREIPR